MIHASGDFSVKPLFKFTPGACKIGIDALKAGAPILTDTSMAAAAVSPMSKRTLKSKVRCIFDWEQKFMDKEFSTRSSFAMKKSWEDIVMTDAENLKPIVLIGSSPTALMTLLDLLEKGVPKPSLIVGMPVGFVGVLESKRRLIDSEYPYITLDGSRGGASMVAATVNALLRAATVG